MQKNKQCFGLRTIHNITFNAAKHCVRPPSNKRNLFESWENFIMLKTNTRPPAILSFLSWTYQKLNDGIDHCLWNSFLKWMKSLFRCQMLHWISKQVNRGFQGSKNKFSWHEKQKENINPSEPWCSIESLMSKSKHVEKTIGLCYSIERNVYTYAWMVYFLHILSYRLCEW